MRCKGRVNNPSVQIFFAIKTQAHSDHKKVSSTTLFWGSSNAQKIIIELVLFEKKFLPNFNILDPNSVSQKLILQSNFPNIVYLPTEKKLIADWRGMI